MKIIDKELLQEFRQKTVCELCGRYARNPLEPHHVFSRGHGGGNRLDHPYNLIALCGAFKNDCHGKAQRYEISRDEIIAIVAKREGLTAENLLIELYALIRAPKRSPAQDPLKGSGRVRRKLP